MVGLYGKQIQREITGTHVTCESITEKFKGKLSLKSVTIAKENISFSSKEESWFLIKFFFFFLIT